MDTIMTPEAALYRYLSGFGIPAYASTSVPDQDSGQWQGFPYITYELVIGDGWAGTEVNVPVNVFYRTESEAAPNAKVREMYHAIGAGGTTVPCDGGMLWIKRGSPWAQAMDISGEDPMVKRRYVNVNIEYVLTD